MAKKKKAERLSSEEVLAFVPESFRDGARVIYNADNDEYLVYYVLDVDYEAEDPSRCVTRLAVGAVHDGQWVVCRSFELLMMQSQKREAQLQAELKAQLAAAKEEEQALLKELAELKQAVAATAQEQVQLIEQQAKLKLRLAQLQAQLATQDASSQPMADNDSAQAPDSVSAQASDKASAQAHEDALDDEPEAQHQIIAGADYEITKL